MLYKASIHLLMSDGPAFHLPLVKGEVLQQSRLFTTHITSNLKQLTLLYHLPIEILTQLNDHQKS